MTKHVVNQDNISPFKPKPGLRLRTMPTKVFVYETKGHHRKGSKVRQSGEIAAVNLDGDDEFWSFFIRKLEEIAEVSEL